MTNQPSVLRAVGAGLRSLGIGVGVAALLLGCGPNGYISLEVDSDLIIPDEINRLVGELRGVDNPDQVLATLEEDLTNHQFPILLLFEPSAETPTEFAAHLYGYLDDQLVARIDVATTWVPGKHTVVRVPLERLD